MLVETNPVSSCLLCMSVDRPEPCTVAAFGLLIIQAKFDSRIKIQEVIK